ncbi:hypothetical protein ALC57_13870, partial [Trachymyrmex cornetzi]
FNPCSGHLVFIKSQARSFRALRVSVLLSTVTVSRIRPNWNKNVTSAPSMMLCEFFPVIILYNVAYPAHKEFRNRPMQHARSDLDVRRGCSPSPQERGGIIDRTIASQSASVTVVRAVKSMPDTHSPMTFYSYLQVTDPP